MRTGYVKPLIEIKYRLSHTHAEIVDTLGISTVSDNVTPLALPHASVSTVLLLVMISFVEVTLIVCILAKIFAAQVCLTFIENSLSLLTKSVTCSWIS